MATNCGSSVRWPRELRRLGINVETSRHRRTGLVSTTPMGRNIFYVIGVIVVIIVVLKVLGLW
jgi:hypothetical protein